jgi:hypothetical protein
MYKVVYSSTSQTAQSIFSDFSDLFDLYDGGLNEYVRSWKSHACTVLGGREREDDLIKLQPSSPDMKVPEEY